MPQNSGFIAPQVYIGQLKAKRRLTLHIRFQLVIFSSRTAWLNAMHRFFPFHFLVTISLFLPGPALSQCGMCGQTEKIGWCGSLAGVEKSHCNGPLAIWGQPIKEASSELSNWSFCVNNKIRCQASFQALVEKLSLLLTPGESISCYFRVDEQGHVFGVKAFAFAAHNSLKFDVERTFKALKKVHSPPNLLPAQIGMVGTFFCDETKVQFCVVPAPADNVKIGAFSGVGETVLEHYLWTSEQRKNRKNFGMLCVGEFD